MRAAPPGLGAALGPPLAPPLSLRVSCAAAAVRPAGDEVAYLPPNVACHSAELMRGAAANGLPVLKPSLLR